MSESPYIVELNPENFQQVVLTGSSDVPVLVDFWADWCQPCKTLMPILSQLAEAYQGKFILAKLNTEEHKELAAQFGIRSLPTVKLFKDGQPVDEFMGALPEADIRAFLDKHIPRESDNVITTAHQHLLQGDGVTAITLLQRAREMDPGNHRVTIALAQSHAALGQAQEALDILDSLPADQQEAHEVKSLRGHLHFEAQAELESMAQVKEHLQADANNQQALLQLAAHHIVEEQYPQALDVLLTSMKINRDFQEQAAQKNMLKIFEILGDDPLVSQYRNQMLNLIY